jgi:lysophospholipase L1-like esterase
MTRTVYSGLATAVSLAASLWAVSSPAVAAPLQTYIAIGDSIAFGETDFTGNPSYGDRGYVLPYSNFLAAQDHDRAPIVMNLGVDGETSTTFFQGAPHGANGAGTPGDPAPQWNLNYDPSNLTSQNAALLSTIASEKAAGHNISTVSVQLGANDLYQLVSNPSFFALSPVQQQVSLAQTLATVQANDTNLLAELRTALPQANILMMGYYNPYVVAPSSPFAQLADPAIKALNNVIAGEAGIFGAKYVDTYSAIAGHEASDTFIASGNPHPNAAGYSALAGQMASQTVPEPTTLAVVGVGFAGLVIRHRRRLRRAV